MIEIKPRHCSVDEVSALLKEVEGLPDTSTSLWSNNERILIDFCVRLGAALAGEHMLRRSDVDGDLVNPKYIDNLLRDADEAHEGMELDEDVGDRFVDDLMVIKEVIDTLRKQVAIRRRMAAPKPDDVVDPAAMPQPMRDIYNMLSTWRLTEVVTDDACGLQLIDVLSTTDLTMAQGQREAAALAAGLTSLIGRCIA